MKAFLFVPLVLFSLALLLGCGRAQSPIVSTELVPPQASFIAQLQLERLLQDADFAELFQQASPGLGQAQNLDELLEHVQQETGVDFRQFQSAVLFGNVAQDGEYFGVIARGQMDEDRLIAVLEESGEYTITAEGHAFHEVYVDQADPDNTAIAFLDDDVLALGSLSAVQDVIDVQQGNLPRASGKVYDTFTELGEPLFSMAMTLPPEATRDFQDSLGEGQGFGVIPALDAFADLEIISLVVDKPGSDLKVEAALDFLSAESASDVRYTLDGFLNLVAAFSPDPETRALLERVESAIQGSRLTIKFQAPVAEIMHVARTNGLEP